MKALKWILIVLVLLIVLTVAIGYMLPREIVVTTSEKINLRPQKVFHFIAAFIDRSAWDPWTKADTAAECTFDLQDGYIGSQYTWDSKKAWYGTEVVDSVVPGSLILTRLSFNRGPEMPEEWTFTRDEGGTDLTWTIKTATEGPVGRIANTILKKTLQKKMESAKINLKNYLETHEVQLSSTTDLGVDDFAAFEALVCNGSGTIEQSARILGEYFGKVMSAIEAQGLKTQGMPFALYTNFDSATGRCDIAAGFPVSFGGKSSGEVMAVKYPSFQAVKAINTGPYWDITETYKALQAFADTNNLSLTGDSWEYYFNSPNEVKDPTKLQTLVVMPIKK
jgi:effector-binding domain-containing protein